MFHSIVLQKRDHFITTSLICNNTIEKTADALSLIKDLIAEMHRPWSHCVRNKKEQRDAVV